MRVIVIGHMVRGHMVGVLKKSAKQRDGAAAAAKVRATSICVVVAFSTSGFSRRNWPWLLFIAKKHVQHTESYFNHSDRTHRGPISEPLSKRRSTSKLKTAEHKDETLDQRYGRSLVSSLSSSGFCDTLVIHQTTPPLSLCRLPLIFNLMLVVVTVKINSFQFQTIHLKVSQPLVQDQNESSNMINLAS